MMTNALVYFIAWCFGASLIYFRVMVSLVAEFSEAFRSPVSLHQVMVISLGVEDCLDIDTGAGRACLHFECAAGAGTTRALGRETKTHYIRSRPYHSTFMGTPGLLLRIMNNGKCGHLPASVMRNRALWVASYRECGLYGLL